MTATGTVLRCAEIAMLCATFLFQPLSEQPDNSQAWSQVVRFLNIMLNGLTLVAAPVCDGWRCAFVAHNYACAPPPGEWSAAETLRVCTSIYILFSAAFWWHRILVTGSIDLANRHRLCGPTSAIGTSGGLNSSSCSSVWWFPTLQDVSTVSLLAAALFTIDFTLLRRLHRQHRVTSGKGVLLLAQITACASIIGMLRESPACTNLLTSCSCLCTGWLVLVASSLVLLRHHDREVTEALDGTSGVEEVWVAALALCGHSVAGVLLLTFGHELGSLCPHSLLCLHGLAGAISLLQLVHTFTQWRH